MSVRRSFGGGGAKDQWSSENRFAAAARCGPPQHRCGPCKHVGLSHTNPFPGPCKGWTMDVYHTRYCAWCPPCTSPPRPLRSHPYRKEPSRQLPRANHPLLYQARPTATGDTGVARRGTPQIPPNRHCGARTIPPLFTMFLLCLFTGKRRPSDILCTPIAHHCVAVSRLFVVVSALLPCLRFACICRTSCRGATHFLHNSVKLAGPGRPTAPPPPESPPSRGGWACRACK